MVMVDQLVVVVRDRLESLLQNTRQNAENWVAITNPVEMDGTPSEGLANKVILSLVSLQTDPVSSPFVAPQPGAGHMYPVSAPRLVLDAYLLIAPNFAGSHYLGGLAMLSEIISYLQEMPVLSAAEIPELPDDCPRVAVEFVSLDFAQANNLMMIIGIKCFPFLLYRLRRLPFEGPAISAVAHPVRAATPEARPRVPQ
jgi:hypothetical protein